MSWYCIAIDEHIGRTAKEQKLVDDDMAAATSLDTSNPFFRIGQIHLTRISSEIVKHRHVEVHVTLFSLGSMESGSGCIQQRQQEQCARVCTEQAQTGKAAGARTQLAIVSVSAPRST